MSWGMLDLSPVPVLDHGRIQLVDVMGSDDAIESAARVSYAGTGDEERLPEDTRKLLRHLMREWHTSPFEMAELKFYVKAPIFVARQWVRHRMASWNEISGRYTELPDECYQPAPDRIQKQSASNKQGSGEAFGPEAQLALSNGFFHEASNIKDEYRSRLRAGMAKELARANLPVSQYTEWVWKVDLHNLMNFLRLRLDSHAQMEIRVYAEKIAKWVKQLFPITWEAFVDYRLEAVTFSRIEMIIIQEALEYNCTREQVIERAKKLGMPPREIRRLTSVVSFL